ncbi:MAG: hypothetical protein FWG83_05830, partial [Oscillospiraceae bacterium]|nr:hypothetical protein [Oscillospiraceae bacterium]
MKKNLILYPVLLLLLAVFIYMEVSAYSMYFANVNAAEDLVIEKANHYAELYENGADLATLVKSSGSTRITVISSNG